MERSYDQYCGLAQALDHVGDRWTLLIVRELLLGPRRYTDLRANLPSIATNLLAERLRRLEDDGIVARRQLPPPAPATVYELTPYGRELEGPVLGLIRWGGRWMLERGEGQSFRAGWLGLALSALIPPDRTAGVRLRCRMDVEGEQLDLVVDDGTVRTETPSGEPEVVVEGEPGTLLGVAAGVIGFRDALATGDLIVTGPARLVRRLSAVLGGGPGSMRDPVRS